MRYLTNKLLITITVIILSAFGIIFFTAKPSVAVPKVAWTPDSLTATILAGESQRIPVSFISTENIENAEIRVVPELAPYVQTEPTSLSNIKAGEPINLDVIVSAPGDALPRTLDGTIQIRNAGKPPKNFAKPLKVVVEVGWKSFSDDRLGLMIEYPPTWIIRPGERMTIFSNVSEPGELTEDALQTESFFGIGLLSGKNPNALPISQWFDQFFSGGFSSVPDAKNSLTIDGHDAVRIEISEIGKRVHIYVAKQQDVIEITYGLFAPQFIDEYELMLNNLRFAH